MQAWFFSAHYWTVFIWFIGTPAQHSTSSILSPVVAREMAGIGRGGEILPADGVVGNYTVRDGKPQIGRGRSQLRERDHVIVFLWPENVDTVRQLFE